MPTQIYNRILTGGISENAAQLSSSTFARPCTLPVGWNKIRFGFTYHFTNYVTTFQGGICAFGFCSGTTNLYGDLSCTHFVGVKFGGPTIVWYNYNTPPNLQYQTDGNYTVASVKVGSVETTSPTTSIGRIPTTAYHYVNAGANNNAVDRAMLVCDITKGSPNYTINMPFYQNNYNQNVDTDDATFLQLMAMLAPAPSGYTTLTQPQTLAVNEATNGTLNAITVFWNQTGINLEILCLAVAVLS